MNRSSLPLRRGSARAARRGSVAVVTLVSLPALLLVLAGVVHIAMMRDTKTDLQNAADAAALAAAGSLDDSLLTRNPGAVRDSLPAAVDAAVKTAAANHAGGTPVVLDPAEDVEFGRLDTPLSDAFEPVRAGRPLDLLTVNAARVTTGRSVGKLPTEKHARELTVRAVAMLDFHTVGLRPTFDKPVPLAPVAVYSPNGLVGPFLPDRSLEAQSLLSVAQRPGSVPEVTLLLGVHSPTRNVAQAWPLRVGAAGWAAFNAQVRNGVAPADLSGADFPHGFELAADRTLPVPAGQSVNAASGSDRAATMAALNAIKDSGSPRVWPVFGRFDQPGRVVATGFFAARVTAVAAGSAGTIKVTVRPTVFTTPTALTRPEPPPGPFGLSVFSRTVCRLRLAE